ncbi:MAG: DUF4349 domain-containing protein [Rhizorhabdus sp.]
MKRMISAMIAVALLGACGKAPDGTATRTTDVAEEAPAAAPASGAAAAIKVAAPQIAYVYRFGYRLPEASVATVQDRHIALCDRLGTGCRLLDMQRAADEGGSGTASLKLMVRADLARQFGRALAAAASQAGGVEADSSIAAEDLSKQMVDTEARLRAKQALADRLMELLRTRNGPVADLVAAERSVADVQEEIDAARSWLAEARGRVAMSTVELTYASNGAGGGFIAPLRSSFRTMSGFLGQSLALLIQLVAVLLPWLIVGGAIAFAVRWFRRRRRSPDAAD